MSYKNHSLMYDRRDLPNSHYEKFTLTGEIKCIDDEIPFDLPKGWGWCRLGEVAELINGRAYKKEELQKKGKYKVLRVGNLFTNNEWFYSDLELPKDKYCHDGDLIYAWSASFGPYIWEGKQTIFHYHIWNVKYDKFAIFRDYLYYFLEYDKNRIRESTTGTTMIHISMENMTPRFIPLPPFAEQQRIVAKIEELMPLVEQYGKAQSELEALNSNIREQLKKSVLQYAIEGKLEPQCEEDGTAEDLLREIQAEKQRLYAEGKIKKKDLAHSTIFRGEDNKYCEQIGKTCACIDNQIPFEIPLSWRWVRIKDIVKINPKNERSDDTIAAFIPMEKIEATFLSQFSYTKVHWDEIKSAFTHFADGDIAFAKISPCFQNRKSMVLQNLPNGIGAGTTELKVLRPYGETIQPFFLMYFLETSYFVENASFKGTANQQRILVGYLENKLLPLPPLREQRQISNTITDFLHLLG